jgi:murein DD-endopeptidase MepM/ murein hydrolase activator NlpD
VNESTLPRLAFFGLAVYALADFLEDRMFWHLKPSELADFVWPVGIYNGRAPEVTDTYSRTKTLSHRKHLGVDIMYRKRAGDPEGLPLSSKNYTSQDRNAPIVAASSGVIWDASLSPRGYQITLDHDKAGVVTYYQHLSRFQRAWSKGDRVEAGQLLGHMGGDVSPGANPVFHLHFELLFPRAGYGRDAWTADPLPYMKLWQKVAAA